MTIVDLECHPGNFLGGLYEIANLCKRSQLPEMQMAGIMMSKEITRLESLMMERRVHDSG